jgi:hypothetical protein
MEFSSKTFILNVFIFVLIFFIIIIFIDITGLNLNQQEPPQKLLKTITIETMNNLTLPSMNKYDDFCKGHIGSTDKLESSCNNLTNSNCNEVSCCVNLNGNKCVAGNERGPIYKTEKTGDKINVDYYYYKNKCYGNCSTKQK